jgi:antitoxin YefM
MVMTTTLPLNEVKAKLSEMVGRAQDHHEEIVITVHGKPAAVLISVYELESMRETLDVLADPEMVKALTDAKDDPTRYTLEEVRAEMAA